MRSTSANPWADPAILAVTAFAGLQACGQVADFPDTSTKADAVVTDDTGWGQWYVGNLATALLPPASTVHVDDVTIGPAP